MTNNPYPFTAVFEENWQEIYKEFLNVNKLLTEWPEHEIYNYGWDVFMLFDTSCNEINKNTQLCPTTTSIIKKNVSRYGIAGFSRLRANTIIKPHVGYGGGYFRMHLGLEIPDGDCGLRSKNQILRWSPGKTLIFDDTFMHDAWNKTKHDRVVLIVDFIP